MIDIIETSIEEFEKEMYHEYMELFPEDERRPLYKIKRTYDNGIEIIYKIMLNHILIGFILLEKLENYPYYLDYFAIFKEYQNKGHGSEAMKQLIGKIKDNGLVCEIEKINNADNNSKKRFDFYKRLGFEKINSEYLLYNVLYTPIVYGVSYSKSEIDRICFDYYITNSGKEEAEKNCKLIK